MLQYSVNEKLSGQQKDDVISLLNENASSLLQHPDWVDITQPGRKKLYISAYNNEKVLTCYALVSVKWWHGVIWFGPVCSNPEYLAEFILKAAELSRKSGIGLLSVVDLYSDKIRNSIFEKVQKEYCITLKNCVNTWATIKIDLWQKEEELFSSFSDNHKRAIRKATKLGFTVRQINNDTEIILFSKIYSEMYQKRKIIMSIRDPTKMFNEILNFFNKTSKGSIWGVYDNDILIGGIVIGYHGKTAFYHYGASNKDLYKKPVMHILFYEAMKAMKGKGFIYFDLGGYALSTDTDMQLSNINRFKSGFGGRVIYDGDPINLILSRPKYYLIIYLKSSVRKLLTYVRILF